MAGVGGVLYDMARSEGFPKEERFPRLFFQLNPTVYLSVGKSRKRFSFNLASFPQMIPLDALRSTLNATNPLSLQAGNPGLKLQNDLSGSAGFQFTDVKKALSFSERLNGSYTFNTSPSDARSSSKTPTCPSTTTRHGRVRSSPRRPTSGAITTSGAGSPTHSRSTRCARP